MAHSDISSSKVYFQTESKLRVFRIFVPLFLLSSLFLIIGFKFNASRTLFNYLLAFTFLMSLGLGGLFFSMLHHATGASWSVVVRRIPESLAHLLPWGFILILPVFFGLDFLYEWSRQESAHDAILTHKAAYLNDTFFIIRNIFYFTIWTLLYKKIIGTSIAQDQHGDIQITHKLVRWSSAGIVLFAITLTFAAIDWIMSLKAHWFSTIYGVYYFAGSIVAGLSMTIVVLLMLQNKEYLKNVINENHFHDLGKLLFALNVFWAYIAFSQYMLIWYGNIPEETIFFSERGHSGWHIVSLAVAIGHFVIPFFLLMSRHAKRNMKVLFAGALWLLAMHYLDLFWLIMPNFSKNSVNFGWIEITAIVWMLSLFVLILVWNFNRYALIPLKDPRLKESLEFHQL